MAETEQKKTPDAEPVNLPAAEKSAPKAAKAKPVRTETFAWAGPVEGVCLKDGERVVFEGVLAPGKTALLPKDHRQVAAWIARGFAVPETTFESKEA